MLIGIEPWLHTCLTWCVSHCLARPRSPCPNLSSSGGGTSGAQAGIILPLPPSSARKTGGTSTHAVSCYRGPAETAQHSVLPRRTVGVRLTLTAVCRGGGKARVAQSAGQRSTPLEAVRWGGGKPRVVDSRQGNVRPRARHPRRRRHDLPSSLEPVQRPCRISPAYLAPEPLALSASTPPPCCRRAHVLHSRRRARLPAHASIC